MWLGIAKRVDLISSALDAFDKTFSFQLAIFVQILVNQNW